MATGSQPIANVDTLGNFTNLLNMFKDQKSSTTTTPNISQAGVQEMINQILQSNQGLAAVAGGQKTAGLYNSSVAQQSINDLLARTSAEVARQSAGSTTTQAKKAPLSGNLGTSLLISAGLKKLLGPSLKTLSDKTGISDIGEKLNSSLFGDNGVFSGAFGGGGGIAPVSESLGASEIPTIGSDVLATLPGTIGTDALGTSAGLGFDSLAAGGASDAAAESAIATYGTETGADVAGLAALDSAAAGEGTAVGAESLGGFSGGGLAATGWGALAVAGAADFSDDIKNGSDTQLVGDIVGGLGTGDIIKGFETGNAFDSVNPLGEGLLSSVGVDTKDGSWVICTEMHAQGRLSDDLYQASAQRAQTLSPELLKGYRYWAIPLTRKLRTSRILSSLFGYLAKSRCEYLLGQPRIWGALSVILGEPICTAIGKRVQDSQVEDWRNLYGR